jgi:hypothetical protein
MMRQVPAWYEEKIAPLFRMIEQPVKEHIESAQPDEARLAANAISCGVHGITTLYVGGKLEVV